MSSTTRISCVTLPCVLAAMVCGCTSWNLSRPSLWSMSPEEKPETPTELVAVWTTTVLSHPNRQSTRGFGGRMMFYRTDKNRPVKVDGMLVVYAFDESAKKGDVKPTRKFVFNKEQLATHYSKSELGHSYSVWIPWDEVGGVQTDISLIARFTTVNGEVVVGEQTTQVLPGSKPAAAQTSPPTLARHDFDADDHSVRAASCETPVADGEPKRKMESTSIVVPPNRGRAFPIAVVPPPVERQIAAPAVQQASYQAVISAEPLPGENRQPVGQASGPPSTRYSPGGSQVPAALNVPPKFDRTPWQRPPGAWPHGPGPSLQPAAAPQSASSSPAAGSTSY